MRFGGIDFKMLIWANKNEINNEMMDIIETMYSEKLGMKDVKNELKAWELSIIFKHIQKHFGKRKDISILDFGAGASPFGAYLNHIGYNLVTCLDKNHKEWHPEINQETYNKKYDAHVKYIKVDIEKYDIGKHDVIFSASVLEHIKDKAIKLLRVLSQSLKSNGLFIHIVDYDRGINFKELIDNCGVPILYKPEETPGCEEFKSPPEYVWMMGKNSRIAFFNGRESK